MNSKLLNEWDVLGIYKEWLADGNYLLSTNHSSASMPRRKFID